MVLHHIKVVKSKYYFLNSGWFCLTGGMTNLCLFNACWNDHLVNFLSDASLWNQYKFISFNIFSCRILVISCKILIITAISNDKTDELSIYAKSCRNVAIFCRQELASLFQLQEKLIAWGNSRLSFSSKYFTDDDSHIKSISSCTVVLKVLTVLYFWDNFHLLKHYPKKAAQNYFDSFNSSNKTSTKISIF